MLHNILTGSTSLTIQSSYSIFIPVFTNMLVFVYILLLILEALLSICTVIRVRRDSVLGVMDVKKSFHLMLIKDERVWCYALVSLCWPVLWCRTRIQSILQPPSSLILPCIVILCWCREILCWYISFSQWKTCDKNTNIKRKNLQNNDVCSMTVCCTIQVIMKRN